MKFTKKRPSLGVYAKRILLWTLPIFLVQAVFLVLFLFSKSGYELASAGVLISAMLDGIGKSLVLSVFSCFIFDLLEKRDGKRTDH